MKLSFTELVIKTVLIFGWLNYTVHEYSHLFMTRLLGYYGEIRSTDLNHVHLTFATQPTQLHLWLIYGAGGLGAFITFMALSWRNDCPESIENNMVFKMIAITNLIYGVFEAFFPSTLWGVGGLVGMLTAVAYFTYILFTKKPTVTL